MYINKHFLHNIDYGNPEIYLKELLKDIINTMSELCLKNELDFDESLKTVSYINSFNQLNNFPLIRFNLSDIYSSYSFLNLLENYYDKFLHKNKEINYQKLQVKTKIDLDNSKYDPIQKNINELRDNFMKSNLFQKENKEKILEKLESIQNEINKIMAINFDNSLDKLIFNQNHNEDLCLIESKLYLEYKIRKII